MRHKIYFEAVLCQIHIDFVISGAIICDIGVDRMKIWQCLLLVIILVAMPFLSVCGPSKAELEYEEYVKTQEEAQQRVEAEQRAQKARELEDIRNWCIEVAIIIRNDNELVVAWNEFRESFDRINPYSSWDVKNQQEDKFLEYMECWETLGAEVNGLSSPTACFQTGRTLSKYFSKQRPAINDLILYFASGQDYYRILYNEKLAEIKGLRKQYLKEFDNILDEYDLYDVIPQ